MSTNQVDYEINKELGECYLFMGDYEKARGYYLTAIENDTTQTDPYIGLAAIALAANALDDAYLLYKKANTIKESDKSLAGMGMIECEQGRYDNAFANFTAALEHNPANIVALNSLVQLCHFLGQLDRTIPYLESALLINDDEAIRFTLAGCLLALGREDESKAQLEILLQVNPDNSEAKQLYAQLAA